MLAHVQALGNFSLYDYREPRAVPEELKEAFRVVVADPPYLVCFACTCLRLCPISPCSCLKMYGAALLCTMPSQCILCTLCTVLGTYVRRSQIWQLHKCECPR